MIAFALVIGCLWNQVLVPKETFIQCLLFRIFRPSMGSYTPVPQSYDKASHNSIDNNTTDQVQVALINADDDEIVDKEDEDLETSSRDDMTVV